MEILDLYHPNIMSKNKHPYIDFNFKCGQDWSQMEDRKKGRYCSSCKKDLIDFSLMNNLEAVGYLQKNRTSQICGKMSSSQLAQLNTVVGLQDQRNFSLKAILAGTALGISTIASAQCPLPVIHQNETIKVELVNSNFNADSLVENRIRGTVVDTTGEPISYMKVVLPEGNQGVYTDFDGKFEFLYDVDIPGKIYFSSREYGSDSSMIANDFANKEIRVVMKTDYAIELEMIGVITYSPTPANWFNTRVRAFAHFVRGRRE